MLPLFAVSVAFLAIILGILINPNLTIKTYCQVYPKEKWALTKGNDGQLISSMMDYETGHTAQYSLNQFERGEYISLKFAHNMSSQDYIMKGDTIASIISSEVEDQLISALGELDIAKANFINQSAGQKESMIKEAENRLKYTDEKIKENKVLFQRISVLYEKGLSSQEEYDNQKWALDLLEIERQIYKAVLENVSTGVKEEEIALFESRINSIKSRLEFLRKRKNNLTIISPISGHSASTFSPDTLFTIINDNEIILNMPLRIEDIDLIKKGQIININSDDLEKQYSGLIVSVSPEVKFVNNRQVFFVSVKINNGEGKFIPGMVKEIFLEIKKITLYEYVKRFFTA